MSAPLVPVQRAETPECENCNTNTAIIFIDVILLPQFVNRDHDIKLCAECYVTLWMAGVRMGSYDAQGNLCNHVSLGRYGT